MDETDHTPARGKKNGHANGHDHGQSASARGQSKPASQKGSNGGSQKGKSARPAKAAAPAGMREFPSSDLEQSAESRPDGRDWSKPLFLPKTDFGMKAGLPQLEPKLLERWAKLGIYKLLRKAAKGREKFVLHDGPP